MERAEEQELRIVVSHLENDILKLRNDNEKYQITVEQLNSVISELQTRLHYDSKFYLKGIF